MLTLEEALKIAKKEEDYDYELYNEYNGCYIFCCGDPECWISVNKKTGEVTTIWMSALMFEHLDDDDFCKKLNDACINAKFIK